MLVLKTSTLVTCVTTRGHKIVLQVTWNYTSRNASGITLQRSIRLICLEKVCGAALCVLVECKGIRTTSRQYEAHFSTVFSTKIAWETTRDVDQQRWLRDESDYTSAVVNLIGQISSILLDDLLPDARTCTRNCSAGLFFAPVCHRRSSFVRKITTDFVFLFCEVCCMHKSSISYIRAKSAF